MTDETISIEHKQSAQGGEYRATTGDGSHAGELTWHDGGEGVHVADHTGVPSAMRGRGIAEKLVHALIDDAREHDFRIVPACSYVAAQFRRHPEWAELKA